MAPPHTWRDFRRRKRAFWAVFLLYLPVVLLVSFVLRALGLGESWALGAAVTWMALWTVAGSWLARFRCPSCGEPFFSKGRAGNVWSNACRQCGARPPHETR
jgi:hypothetical protein